MHRRGFTLIEIMAVVVLIGLLAGATAWSLAGQAQHTNHAEALDRLIHADTTARLASRRLGPARLELNLDTQTLRLLTPDPDPAKKTLSAGSPIRLPANHRLASIRYTPEPNAPAIEQRTGIVRLTYTNGRTQTHALQILGPPVADPDRRQASDKPLTTWLLIPGLTGHAATYDDSEPIDNLLR